MSPTGKHIKKRNGKWNIPGVACLDLMELYKKFSYQNQSSYSLNYIGLQEVGEGKLDFEGQINDLWSRDWELFVDYNIQDCFLVRKIEAKRKFIDLVINLCTETRTPFERVVSTISVVEGYMLRYMHRKNIIFPDNINLSYDDDAEDEKIEGGYVEAHPGFYNFLLSIDATSLYPSNIRMFNISPETKVLNPDVTHNLIKTPIEGLYYTKETGILPEVVSDIFFERKRFQAEMKKSRDAGDHVMEEYFDAQQLIRKILVNSIYGVLCNKFFHFFDLDNASAVTAIGREAIQYIAKCNCEFFKNVFPEIATEYYPNSTLKKTDVPNRIVRVIDTDSVVGDSIINTNVGDISIERLYEKYTTEIIETSKDNFKAKLDGIKSLSFNTKTKQAEYGNTLYIKKHLVKKRMFKIKCGDKEVIVTEDHSVIVKRNNIYMSISAKNIIKGDIITYVDFKKGLPK
jgi:DNA polymerase elongation subunit (family B)